MTKYLAFFNNVTNGPKSHNDLLSFHNYHSNEKFTCNHKLIYNFAVCCILFIGNELAFKWLNRVMTEIFPTTYC